MERIMRNAPSLAVLVALVIQITRVNDFGVRIGAGWLAWVFAGFLAVTIYALSYWSGRLKYEVTASPEDKRSYAQQMRMERLYSRARNNAQFWLLAFVAIDGAINLSETMAALPTGVTSWEKGGAIIYGIFPTLAAVGLGSLQAVLDRIPSVASKRSLVSKLVDKLSARWLDEPQEGSKASKQADALQVQGLQASEALADKSNKQVETLQVQGDKPSMQDTDLLAYWEANPQASDAQVARHFQRSTQAIQQRRKKLTERGAFFKQASVEQEIRS